MSNFQLRRHVRQWFGSLSGRGRRGDANRAHERGQVLPIFVAMSVVLLGGAALVTDVAWWWTVEQRMQRAADAGALAGAVYLPGNQARAFSAAYAETARNGYAHGQDGVVVTPRRDPTNERKLIVDIDGEVDTNFARVFTINDLPASVTGAAEFVLPVPMGSPENYYGVFGKLNTEDGGKYVAGPSGTAEGTPSTAPSGSWAPADVATLVGNVQSVDGDFARTNSNGATQWFGGFNLLDTIPAPGPGETLRIDGIEVLLDDAYVTASCGDSYIQAHLSWNGGSSRTSAPSPSDLNDARPLTTSPNDFTIGEPGNTRAFPGHNWVRNDFVDSRFRVRLSATKACGNSSTQLRVDQLRVRVHWSMSTFVPDANVAGPQGQVLTPRGFWASMMTQGAETRNGDAFLPFYDRRTSSDNVAHDPQEYYNYAVEMPPGSSSGSVWLYDPGFCAGDLKLGLGDSWAGGNSPVSSFYTLYEDQFRTPYYFGDDSAVASSGNLFRRSAGRDGNLGASGVSGPVGCDEYHLKWYQLAGGLSGGSEGRVYRLHATTYDETDVSGQRQANARNHFSVFVDANGGTGTPRIYGIGAMGMFTQLPGGQSSEFYLAQIEEAHKGKTMEIRLWDAGDTNQNANLQILAPTSTGWSSVPLTYSAARGSFAASYSYCDDTARSGTSIVTNQGGNRYNGCWLTITVPLPADYSAPQDGWWKIRYNMTGSSTATDITTWQVALLGNPVHLVQE